MASSIAYASNLALLCCKNHHNDDAAVSASSPNAHFVAPLNFMRLSNNYRIRSCSQSVGVPLAAAKVVDDRIAEKEEQAVKKRRVLRVGIVCGGPSAERGISLNSARSILDNIQGRPKGVTPKYSLKPLVPRLSELLEVKVEIANDCIGEEVEKLVAAIPEGGVLLLENVRFHKEEEKNDPEFAKKLASLADLYVNDAFGTAHRAHASTEGVTKFLKPSVAGFLMQKELDYLVGAISNPRRPFAAIVGGSKVSSKIGVIESLLEKVNILLLGGGMIFTFYKAQGHSVGSSLVEEDKLDLATSLLEKAKSKGVALLLPTDVVIADKFAADANSKVVPASGIPDGWMGLDIGPDSIKTFNESLDTTKTVIWNGPMGVFEFEKFAVGTEAIEKKLADLSGKGVTTIIGGGDSVAAVEKVGLADKMSHISTGGGASLELLEGRSLPGVLALDDCHQCCSLRPFLSIFLIASIYNVTCTYFYDVFWIINHL